MTNLWHDAPSDSANTVGIIEIPRNSTLKYELHKDTGGIVLDRTLAISCPANYGFIPRTLGDDSDPADVFLLTEHELHPLAMVRIEVVGVIKLLDNGVRDDKFIATIKGEDIGPYAEDAIIDQIIDYLNAYKKGIEILELGDCVMAHLLLDEAYKTYSIARTKAMIRPYAIGVQS